MPRLYRPLVPILAACVAALGLTGCTTAWPHLSYSDGDLSFETYTCNWKSNSSYLKPGCEPNSPILPYMRGTCESPRNFVGALFVLPLALDLVGSPLAYYFDRDCSHSGSTVVWHKTPDYVKRQRAEEKLARKRQREQEKLEASQEYQEQQKRLAEQRAAQEKLAAEQREMEALYPPLDESPKAEPQRPHDFALIVGIENYQSSLPKADFAENDAALVAKYVQALGVPKENVISLTGDKASRAAMAKYLEEWLPANVKPDSRVYFYYSGHGAPDPTTGTAYLVPWDGDVNFLKSTAFPLAKLYSDLAALPNKDSVVMLDSCFSGTGGRSVLAQGVRPLILLEDTTQPPEKAAVLAASGAREIAGGLDLRKHGLFTYFLLRGLNGEADQAHTGHITAADLESYVQARVSDTAHRANRDQHPRLLGDGSLKLY